MLGGEGETPAPKPQHCRPGQIAQGVGRHTCVCVFGAGGESYVPCGDVTTPPPATAASLEKFVRGLLGAVAQVGEGRRKCDSVCVCEFAHFLSTSEGRGIEWGGHCLRGWAGEKGAGGADLWGEAGTQPRRPLSSGGCPPLAGGSTGEWARGPPAGAQDPAGDEVRETGGRCV